MGKLVDPDTPVEDMAEEDQKYFIAMRTWTKHYLDHIERHLKEGEDPILVVDAHLCASFNAIQSIAALATNRELFISEFRDAFMKYATRLTADTDTPETKH